MFQIIARTLSTLKVQVAGTGFLLLLAAACLGAPLARAQGVLVNPEPTTLYFLQQRLAHTLPPLDALTQFDPDVQHADEFHKKDAVDKARNRLVAKQESVNGVTELVINLQSNFGEYDDQYKEYDFDLSDGTNIPFQWPFSREVRLALTNGTKAQTWSLSPDEAAAVLAKTKGRRYATLVLKMKVLDSPPAVDGEPMIINCKIEEYEILDNFTSRHLGKVVVPQ